MRRSRVRVLAAIVRASSRPRAAIAQTLGRAAVAAARSRVACAPPPTFDGRAGRCAARSSARRTRRRARCSAPRDLLVIDGGTDAGVQLGQQFFVRRANPLRHRRATRRAGQLSTRRLDPHRRGQRHRRRSRRSTTPAARSAQSDYLEPFVAPVVPAGRRARRHARRARLHVARPRRRRATRIAATGGAGDFMLIDQRQRPGRDRRARGSPIYRDVGVSGMPLAGVGEAVVISTGADDVARRGSRARATPCIQRRLSSRRGNRTPVSRLLRVRRLRSSAVVRRGSRRRAG